MHQLKSIHFPHDLSGFSEIIDVRSPDEYAHDHIPGAINLPSLNSKERAEVGTIYKKNPFEARKLGAGYISKNVAHHLSTYLADKDSGYHPLLYCWRGGMRSRSFSFILQSIGWNTHIVSGGYRAYRKFVIAELERILSHPQLQFRVFSGVTGVGKTKLLHQLSDQGAQVLDLEGLANHKGSLLGAPKSSEQPSQKNFETRLWHCLKDYDPKKAIFTESESNRIGCVHCPPALWKKLSESEVINLALDLDERVKLLLKDYPHFCDDPEGLSTLLEHLVRLRGREQVTHWQELIKNGQWSEFTRSILENHYDLAYRMPGEDNSNYPAPSHSYTLEDSSTASYQSLASNIIQNHIHSSM
ncbi:tRNA 2-selenouridine synthase [Rubritalea squalenifaciens DSM 18772]|uniref:tRNA 2-selenouridine synthase n=1 Tax=Rubritalea squalenifaciens DSM 18772 TaxID=1123071 RepID=A0A1M6HVX6_9BACT|nr:tRNA 2-selenouridine(34) synthase MnmH [Rubritalea squalenifaciens]SHJ26331.1 tRNA 2-selenouridine synthase [Rubritalea squalenifaciens DSM 18772]